MVPQAQIIPEIKSDSRVESRAAALERFVERHQFWILAAWTLVYFAGTMLRARAKPFWYDEILTLLEARQPTLHAAMHALGNVDWMPPASHFTFYWTAKLIGSGEVAFRIPVMIAFWVFCICLYLFARRRVGVLFALTAMLLPYASAFQSYSYEARTYAFLLGFSGIALFCWQSAVEGLNRRWSLFGLAAALAGAIAYQYWAVLIYLPLGAAEAYRSLRRRRVDWPVWGAFAAGGASLIAFLPLILHGVKTWRSYSGMRAHFHSYLTTYEIAFRVYFAFLIPAALLLAAWFLFGGHKAKPEGTREARIPEHEWLAALILLFLPVVAVSIALIVPPHSYSPRYAAPAVAGYALLIAFVAARWAGPRSAVGLACTLAALAPFAYLMATPGRWKNPVTRIPHLRQRLQSGPVVFEDLIPYLKLWYYTPDRLKPNLFCACASDVPAAAEATPFAEFRKLGIPVVRLTSVVHPGANFLFYPSLKRKQMKLLRAVKAAGGSVEMVDDSKPRPLMRARIPRWVISIR